MKEAERFLVLSNIDRLWKEHLQALKFVQQAVGLRGYAQRDPLIEYKLEGYNLFLEMMAQIRRNVIYSIYQVWLYTLFLPLKQMKPWHFETCCSTICCFVHFFQFRPVMVKNQEQVENSGRKKEKKMGADNNANAVGAA